MTEILGYNLSSMGPDWPKVVSQIHIISTKLRLGNVLGILRK